MCAYAAHVTYICMLHTYIHTCADVHHDTHTQAQERGEQLQLLDDAVYALDGMGSSMPAASKRDGALQLLKLCAGRRGIAALR